MEGPYRDLGSGFARLMGQEGARRGPSRIAHVEDALLELLRNARDAGANNVLVASSLSGKRFRTLTVIDDGRGIPGPYADLVFEPGVTTRHLDPVPDPSSPAGAPHGAGLALYHVKQAAVEAAVLSASSPTAIRATFDTRSLPERSLQSASRSSRSNLRTTVANFALATGPDRTRLYYGTPAAVLATLLNIRIIQRVRDAADLRRRAESLGLGVSLRTVQRVLKGEVGFLSPSVAGAVGRAPGGGSGGRRAGDGSGGPVLRVGKEERAEIAAILCRAAGSAYLGVEGLELESRPGEILLRARVYEPEDEYE